MFAYSWSCAAASDKRCVRGASGHSTVGDFLILEKYFSRAMSKEWFAPGESINRHEKVTLRVRFQHVGPDSNIDAFYWGF